MGEKHTLLKSPEVSIFAPFRVTLNRNAPLYTQSDHPTYRSAFAGFMV